MIEWRDVTGYKGLYQVSNLGNIRSLSRQVPFNNRITNKLHYRITNTKIIGKHITPQGYHMVNLRSNNKICKMLVHRLVAYEFIPNPLNKQYVNHKDGNKKNNNVDNLEWVTPAENNQHAIDNGLKKTPSGESHFFSKKICQYDMNDNFVKEWINISEAARNTGIKNSGISNCCLGKRNHAGGFKWKYLLKQE